MSLKLVMIARMLVKRDVPKQANDLMPNCPAEKMVE
jgi:hypothetical protein